METLKKHIYLFAFLIVLFACEDRKEPQPLSGTPVFYLIGEFNEEAFEYYAGIEGLNEAFSYTDSTGREWYASRFELSPEFMSTVMSDFQFEFALSGNSNSNFDLITEAGDVKISYDSAFNYYEVSFESEINNPDFTYSWNFGDGSNSTQMNPIHRYPVGNTDYTVCLNIENNNSCVAELCQTVKPYLSGRLEINATQTGNGLWIFEPVINGFEAINYQWTLSDGNTVNTRQIALQSDSNEVMELCLNTKSRKSEIYEKCNQLNTGINPNACISNFSTNSELKSDTLFNNISDRVISSQLFLNNSTLKIVDFEENYFEIIESEPFQGNASVEVARKVKFKLEFRLVDENGAFHHLKITNGAMAVGVGN